MTGPRVSGGPAVTITVRGGEIGSALRARVMTETQSALARTRVRPTTTTIVFTDENGPKGGATIRCAMTAVVPRQAPIRVAPRAATASLAFSKAIDAFERALSGAPDRRRALSRRPKKYYAAKRMMEPS